MRLISNRRETPTTRVIRLALDGQAFPYEAGQAAWLALEASAEQTPYSIASAPEETTRHGWVEFLVKVDDARRFGAEVSTLRRGTDVRITDAAGSFTFPRDPAPRDLLFIAGGTGIAPVRAMIMHAILSGISARLRLLYSARRPDEFAYLSEMRALARRNLLALELTLTGEYDRWRYGRGRAGLAHLERLVAGGPPLCFLCGPPGMVTDLSLALASLGVPPKHIRKEQW